MSLGLKGRCFRCHSCGGQCALEGVRFSVFSICALVICAPVFPHRREVCRAEGLQRVEWVLSPFGGIVRPLPCLSIPTPRGVVDIRHWDGDTCSTGRPPPLLGSCAGPHRIRPGTGLWRWNSNTGIPRPPCVATAHGD